MVANAPLYAPTVRLTESARLALSGNDLWDRRAVYQTDGTTGYYYFSTDTSTWALDNSSRSENVDILGDAGGLQYWDNSNVRVMRLFIDDSGNLFIDPADGTGDVTIGGGDVNANQATAGNNSALNLQIENVTQAQLLQEGTTGFTILEALATNGALIFVIPGGSGANGWNFFHRGDFENKAVISEKGAFGIKDGITAPSAIAGLAQVYVDTADGDYKIIFGDGTVKTLTTDT